LWLSLGVLDLWLSLGVLDLWLSLEVPDLWLSLGVLDLWLSLGVPDLCGWPVGGVGFPQRLMGWEGFEVGWYRVV
jgi:hypothetical protein